MGARAVLSRKLFNVAMCVLVFSAAGCNTERPRIDVSNVALPEGFEVLNWMDVVHAVPRDNNQAKNWSHFHDADPAFWALWSEAILQAGPAEDTATANVVLAFMRDMKPMLDAIDTTSGSADVLAREEARLMDAFKRFHVLDPNHPLPRIVWMPSGFNVAVYPTDELLAVGLDWFLGASHPLHDELPPSLFPAYRLARMRPELLATSAFRGWVLVRHQSLLGPSPRTAEQLLFWGQCMDVVAQCFPDDAPWTLIDWTAEEWAWAVANERAIWAELQPQDVMFASAPRDVMRWFQEGPFTRAGALPQSCPDRLGVFVGWRMLDAYREAHPDLSHAALMQLSDPLAVMRHYRP